MNTQLTLERNILRLVDEFIKDAYAFFTEADAVATLYSYLHSDGTFNQKHRTPDGYEIDPIHKEYPTFFRFKDKNPIARLDENSGARRGHYDMVILKPDFITSHPADTVANRDNKTKAVLSQAPFEAVLEFKLYNNGWNPGRVQGVRAEFGKLHLTSQECPLRYLIVFMRYKSPRLNRWDWWEEVKRATEQKVDICSVFAIQWLNIKKPPEVFRFGPWRE